ncbi:hypothetical protein GGX14DRAFT_543355 [Mycena pura]|uniref:GATA-type domain-containing protein n=1 Tax=Mycena pura TaxID=153505 RepID=A0AAD6YEH7_9AGAR|nr:hypothetical protein GGX14DRAFT_543355 [Mycena pura]
MSEGNNCDNTDIVPRRFLGESELDLCREGSGLEGPQRAQQQREKESRGVTQQVTGGITHVQIDGPACRMHRLIETRGKIKSYLLISLRLLRQFIPRRSTLLHELQLEWATGLEELGIVDKQGDEEVPEPGRAARRHDEGAVPNSGGAHVAVQTAPSGRSEATSTGDYVSSVFRNAFLTIVAVKVEKSNAGRLTSRAPSDREASVFLDGLLWHPNVLQVLAHQGSIEQKLATGNTAAVSMYDRWHDHVFRQVRGISAALCYLSRKGHLRTLRPDDLDLLIDTVGEVKVSIRNESALPQDDVIMAHSEFDLPHWILDNLCQRAFKEVNRAMKSTDTTRSHRLEGFSNGVPWRRTRGIERRNELTVPVEENSCGKTLVSLKYYRNHLRYYNSKGAKGHHQCPGYRREEISLATTLDESLVVSHSMPRARERCTACGQLVGAIKWCRGCGVTATREWLRGSLASRNDTLVRPGHAMPVALCDSPPGAGAVTVYQCRRQHNARDGIIHGAVSLLFVYVRRIDVLQAADDILGWRPSSEMLQSPRAATPLPTIRKCHACNIRQTPIWRRGTDGAGTLCNACGLRVWRVILLRWYRLCDTYPPDNPKA